ncbi:hypothetical protein E8E13_003222 [Curvularia kusanoi]|uniref:Uncharacterized protein n=1 Tax=Curvularia kusanoi TaxID=90978 RepID=A0A9P4W6X8_CURKU|nr:hypothetical protein E8E13_003222 [Curvularia kusanoi]
MDVNIPHGYNVGNFSNEEASIASTSSLIRGSMSKPAKGEKSRLQKLNPFSRKSHSTTESVENKEEEKDVKARDGD